MITTLIALFCLSAFCIIHSYLFYPFILKVASKNKKQNQVIHNEESKELPQVSFVMSLYNEEAVIEEKIQTLLQQEYPQSKINFILGSDCSDDQTAAIVNKYKQANLLFFDFKERRGKPSVINDLIEFARGEYDDLATEHIIIISDANVMLASKTVYHLVKHFKNESIALVDSNIRNQKFNTLDQGIGLTESSYISREVDIKNQEGRAWACTMGPLGGCYALRASHFVPVPSNNLVDDFYIAMRAFEKGGRAINELQALCYEEVSSSISIEFRRKKRISAGNFTNLALFKHLLWPPTSSLGFAFLSHKVLRWLGPFFMITMYLSLLGLYLMTPNMYSLGLFAVINLAYFGIPLVDMLFQKLNIHIKLLRYIHYFNAMNLALFLGFFKYLSGVKSGVWQRTQREQA